MRSLAVTMVLTGLLGGCFPTGYYLPEVQGQQGVVDATPTGDQPSSVVAGTGQGQQYLYVPTTNIPISAVEQVTVRTSEGRVFELSRGEVQEVATGRVALAIPPGVTDGEVIIVAYGQQLPPIPFHIASAMTTPYLSYSMDQSCSAIAGNWTGNISESDPTARATVMFQVAADCRSISGFIHWEGPRIGSVDSTIAGEWDASSLTLRARDTQLFNVRPLPGGGFCPTELYQLTLSPDGRTLTGVNLSNAARCRGQSSVYLSR